MGVLRDTLIIEVDPKTISFDDLKSKFTNETMLSSLYTYSESTKEDGTETKTLVGEGYKIFVSLSNEMKRSNQVPGRMAPDKSEEVYVVSIAQQTYQEYQLETLKNDTSE